MKENSQKSKLIFNPYQLKERSFLKSNYSARIFCKEHKGLKFVLLLRGFFGRWKGPLNEVLVSIRSTHITQSIKQSLETGFFLNGFSMLC